ncbi:MAG: mandelate racemase/muconate lactonizing enzyme family protein [Alphaproteobacteria bacterium]|nr:mandelate racemase/muconate lactonizing enzyme family protein [Alphaproteobacteria bacterium]
MKITKVRTVPVWGRRRRPFGTVTRTALGAAAISDYTIVFVDTDAGITGLGEVCSVFKRRGALLRSDVDMALAPAVTGEDPFRIAHLVRKMDQALDGVEEAKAGIEMALWDIVGKALKTPVYNLLGGKVRERIPLSYSIPFGTPEQMAAFAVERVKAGHRTIKVKVGSEDGPRDIAAVKAIRAAIGPDVKLRVDGNMGWPTAKHAIRMIRAMEPWDIELVEQPLPAHDLDGMAEVRRSIGVPLMADESIRNPLSAMEVIRRGAADIANVYVTEAGGLLNAMKIFAMCEVAGMPCMIGSMPEFGIGTAAQIHLGVAMTNLGPDSDTCGVLYHEEDLLATPLRIEDGFSYPPEGPGLGVEIDRKVFERWQRSPPADAAE